MDNRKDDARSTRCEGCPDMRERAGEKMCVQAEVRCMDVGTCPLGKTGREMQNKGAGATPRTHAAMLLTYNRKWN